MDSNMTNENPKNIRSAISIIGLVIVIIAMIASVQADGSFIPDISILLGLIIILVAEKSSLNERE